MADDLLFLVADALKASHDSNAQLAELHNGLFLEDTVLDDQRMPYIVLYSISETAEHFKGPTDPIHGMLWQFSVFSKQRGPKEVSTISAALREHFDLNPTLNIPGHSKLFMLERDKTNRFDSTAKAWYRTITYEIKAQKS